MKIVMRMSNMTKLMATRARGNSEDNRSDDE